jgi:hypothetical protein
MSEKKKYLLRLDESLYAALETWAAHDLRSVNAQIEFLLTDSVRKSGRLKPPAENNEGGENASAPAPAS